MIKTKEEIAFQEADLEEMVKLGLHFGHATNKRHPKMEPYIYGVRNGVHIIDVAKTKQKLNEALSEIGKMVSEGKTILLVGTKVQSKKIVKETAEECGIPYINERWLGGTLTNFEAIKKRVDYLKGLEKKKEDGDLEKYTKKERMMIDREISAMKIKFDGIKSLSRLPDAIFVLDMNYDSLAVKEARSKKIRVFAVADTDADPTLADYPIPANDDAISSLTYILGKLKNVVLESRNESQEQ